MADMKIQSWHISHNKATEVLCSKCANCGEGKCNKCQHFDQFVDQRLINKTCEWLRNELPTYLGLFTSHFQDDNDVEQVVVKACVNAQIYDDLKDVMEE